MFKLTSKAAAKHIGIKKRSIDDYLMLVRYGIRFNYDFDLSLDYGVGRLRTFVLLSKQGHFD